MADAAGALESLDITDQVEAYTATGQIITVTADHRPFAHLELTDRTDPARLRALLRRSPGPTHLAHYLAGYAQEWLAATTRLPDHHR